MITLAVCILIGSCTLLPQEDRTNTSVRVTGVGASYESAKQNAFKKAIEYKVGSIVVSETESVGNLITKDNIFLHSAGYVDDFRVTKQTDLPNKVILEMDVKVSSSKLANRILAKVSETREINGVLINDKVNTYLHSKHTGDLLLGKILEGYPVKKFDLTIKNSNFKLDQDRNLYLYIDFNTSWNRQFIDALDETLQNLQDKNKDQNSTEVSITYRNNSFFNPVIKKSYYFNDRMTYSKIIRTFKNNPVHLKVSLYNNDQLIEKFCKPVVTGLIFEEKYNAVNIDTMYIINNKIQIPIENLDLKSITTYNVELVNRQNC